MKKITTADFRDYRRDRFIDAQTTPAVRLAPTYMITNEMGVDGDICEELTPALCAKVEFDIPSAKTKGADFYPPLGRTPNALIFNCRNKEPHRPNANYTTSPT